MGQGQRDPESCVVRDIAGRETVCPLALFYLSLARRPARACACGLLSFIASSRMTQARGTEPAGREEPRPQAQPYPAPSSEASKARRPTRRSSGEAHSLDSCLLHQDRAHVRSRCSWTSSECRDKKARGISCGR